MTKKQAFITAVENGDAWTVENLLATNETLAAQLDAPWFSFDAPAIVFAAASGNRELIDVLLDAGADIDVKSSWWAGGASALHHATGSMLNYNRELAEYLIERGATIDAHAAAGLDMSEKLAELIRENPEVVNEPGCDGMSPLHFAATPRIAELLLAHGADINLRDRDHNGTPAQWTLGSRPEVCQYLLEQGAEGDMVLYCVTGDVERAKAVLQENPALLDLRIDHKVPEGYTIASHDAEGIGEVPGAHVYAYKVGPTMRLLEIALQAKQAAIIKMLMECGYQIKLREWYMIAGQGPRNMDRLVKMFLGKGLDINARQKHRRGVWAPLHWVAQRGLTDGISCLLENGADPNITDDQGRTPIHIIAQKGIGKNQIQLLMKHGGNVSIRDAEGQTPLDYAQKAKRKSAASFLTEYANRAQEPT
ncbi:MAG: ankyrin repeat domain-containing protein [Candidatus Poribacteria bacterium]|nr:ankyrin repeat domain-containing protein [Candidatus Poribacteria bacterium]MDE0425602.1 ankyrin repeat domain-containing protein [Candidatus Poribacteria bacterium]